MATNIMRMQPEILYEDADIVAVNKPAGLVVHGDGKTEEPSLADWILKKFPKSKNVGEPWQTPSGEVIPRPGIVHRLDRETSGVLLVAKTQKGFECLKNQFQKHLIKKEYHAFVYGEMKTDKGIIDRPIGRSNKDFRQWSAQRGSREERREAVTEYQVFAKAQGYSFVHIFPKTGRTHQIRVHFKAINYPLVADSLYAPSRENDLGFDRLALHAHTVTFEDPKGISHTVTSQYPKDFEKALKTFKSRSKSNG